LFGGGGKGETNGDFGRSSATSFLDLHRGGDQSDWTPLAVLGGVGIVLVLIVVMALRRN
jgi:hypothetical protein